MLAAMTAKLGLSADKLRTIPLFSGFASDEIDKLAALASEERPTPGTVLFEKRQTAEHFYVLAAGEVALHHEDDEIHRLHPPALIGELGALTGLPRSTRANVAAGSTVWSLRAKTIQDFLAANQELGVRFLVNLLSVVADKVHRDQGRMADMRQNLMRTQKELKRMRELVLETAETPLSAPIHDTLDRLITTNRRVNYRVAPPVALPVTLRFDTGTGKVIDISRTHVTCVPPAAPGPAGTWLSGVLSLAGTEIPISGKIHRVTDGKVTIELDLLIDEFAASLEGYLTRAQLLDVLV